MRRPLILALFAIISLVSAAHAQLRRPDRRGECGPPVSGIALCLSRSTDLNAVVELRNTSQEDKVLNLGILLANGAKQYPTAITLLLSDAQGKQHRAALSEPTGVIAGRLDPFILPLPAGGAFRLPARLTKCLWQNSAGAPDDFKPGLNQPYTLHAEFVGKKVEEKTDAALMPFWTGEITSNTVSVGRN